MAKPLVSYRRIDQLKALAYDLGFTNDDAKQFGKLTKTATWEALLQLYAVDNETLDTMLDKPLDRNKSYTSYTDLYDTGLSYVEPRDTALNEHNSTFLDWVDFGQLIAVVLASVGVFVLAMSLWRQINPLNLFLPVRINIQIGAKL
jgi:hypothetical protein